MSKNETRNLKLTDRGLDWLKMDLANTYGEDKLTEQSKLDFINNNIQDLLKLEAEAESPFEFKKAREAYESHLRGEEVEHFMYLDCSNQALQIYAVLMGCAETGKICNITGLDTMEDAYQELANAMNDIYSTTLFTRKNNKKALMTSLYGKQNAGGVIYEEMNPTERKALLDLISHDMESFNKKANQAKKVIMPKAMEAMALLQMLNSEHIGTYEWVLPDGFPVKYDVKHMQTYEGQRISKGGIEFSFETEYGVYKPNKYNAGIAPNVIHSIDAYILRKLVRRLHAKGIWVTTIHDAYAVHPNDCDIMIEIYKDIMCEILDSNLLNDIMKQIANGRYFIPIEKDNTLTKEMIRKSKYALY